MHTLERMKLQFEALGMWSCIGLLPARRSSTLSQNVAPTASLGIPSHSIAMVPAQMEMPVKGYVQGRVRFECYDESNDGAQAVGRSVAYVIAAKYGRVLSVYHQDAFSPQGVRWPRYIVEANIGSKF